MILVHNGKIHTNFYNNKEEPTKPPKEYKRDYPFSYGCIPAIVPQSVCKMKKQQCDKYHPQINLEECNYTEKKPGKSNIKRKLIVPE